MTRDRELRRQYADLLEGDFDPSSPLARLVSDLDTVYMGAQPPEHLQVSPQVNRASTSRIDTEDRRVDDWENLGPSRTLPGRPAWLARSLAPLSPASLAYRLRRFRALRESGRGADQDGLEDGWQPVSGRGGLAGPMVGLFTLLMVVVAALALVRREGAPSPPITAAGPTAIPSATTALSALNPQREVVSTREANLPLPDEPTEGPPTTFQNSTDSLLAISRSILEDTLRLIHMGGGPPAEGSETATLLSEHRGDFLFENNWLISEWVGEQRASADRKGVYMVLDRRYEFANTEDARGFFRENSFSTLQEGFTHSPARPETLRPGAGMGDEALAFRGKLPVDQEVVQPGKQVQYYGFQMRVNNIVAVVFVAGDNALSQKQAFEIARAAAEASGNGGEGVTTECETPPAEWEAYPRTPEDTQPAPGPQEANPDSPLAIPRSRLKGFVLENGDTGPPDESTPLADLVKRHAGKELFSNEWVSAAVDMRGAFEAECLEAKGWGMYFVLDARFEFKSERSTKAFLKGSVQAIEEESEAPDLTPLAELTADLKLGDERLIYGALLSPDPEDQILGDGGQIYVFAFRTGRLVAIVGIVGDNAMKEAQVVEMARIAALRIEKERGRTAP